MYAISGATGHIGGQAADILLAKGEKVRVVGRDAVRLQRFVDKGAEAAVGDLNDSAFVARAFSGARGVFAMIPPDLTVQDIRRYQNEIGESIATGIRKSGVRYVVNLSSQGAELAEGTGPILGLRDQEERLNRLAGVNVLHLRPTYFMENLLMNIPLIERMGVAGSPVRGDLKFAMIATRDIGAHLAERLVKRDFEGKEIQELLGERDLSLKEAVSIIGRTIGYPELRYVQFPYEDAAIGMSEMGMSANVAATFIEMAKALNDGLFAVNRPRTATNTTPTTFEEFAEAFGGIYRSSTLRKVA